MHDTAVQVLEVLNIVCLEGGIHFQVDEIDEWTRFVFNLLWFCGRCRETLTFLMNMKPLFKGASQCGFSTRSCWYPCLWVVIAKS